ncbi:MAG: hypothetical protein KDB80_09630, partial [Planctomycetes bacterium]|nr:hypothetical protein [Planctomycetota bacterium]
GLRERIFGESSRPNRPIPPAAKSKNLGSAGRAFLVSGAEDFLRDKLPKQLGAIVTDTIDQYLRAFVDPCLGRCRERQAENHAQLQRDRERFDQLHCLAEAFQRLADRVGNCQTQLAELRASFASERERRNAGGSSEKPVVAN